ncbi:MAG: diacylglycerol/lipid kinase family protein [Gemmatimonadales bacterium]
MRVLVLHNPGAGDAHPSAGELVKAFTAEGHDARYRSTKEGEWMGALAQPFDAVVAAGGDGTVRRVAMALARRPPAVRPPLAIVPLGTANNIARALGVEGSAARVAAGLDRAARTRLAVGSVQAPWGRSRFVESAGVGIFGAMIRMTRDASRRPGAPGGGGGGEQGGRIDRIYRGAETLREALDRAEAQPMHVLADGRDLSGSYFLAEAMNIISIGPCADLAPAADPADDSMELVLAGEAERSILEEYFAALGTRELMPIPIHSHAVREVVLEWSPRDGHLDDELWPDGARSSAAERATVRIEMETVLEVLSSGFWF